MQFSQLKKGSVVTIWHYPKGHNYVVTGYNPSKKKVHLVKLNCFNSDGTIHKATKRFHKSLPYTTIGSTSVVKGVSKILGFKNISEYDLDALLESDQDVRVLPVSKKFHCSPLTDSQQLLNYDPI